MLETSDLPPELRLVANEHGRQFIHVDHPAVQARIALQGAHIIQCRPAGQRPLLWMSPTDPCKPDTALRGGVPLCWPWFADEREGPAHGIARTSNWDLVDARVESETVHLTLELAPETITRQLPDEAWVVRVEFRLAHELEIGLTTTNTGTRPQRLSQALHSYLPVTDIADVEITGLLGCAYIDKLQGATLVQEAPLRFAQEVDRIYLDHHGEIDVHTGDDHLRVSRAGSESVVVWNPWQAKGARLSQFPPDGYRTMVCVEAANAGPDGRVLAPGESHTLATRIGRFA